MTSPLMKFYIQKKKKDVRHQVYTWSVIFVCYGSSDFSIHIQAQKTSLSLPLRTGRGNPNPGDLGNGLKKEKKIKIRNCANVNRHVIFWIVFRIFLNIFYDSGTPGSKKLIPQEN